MESNSNPASKRLKTETLTDDDDENRITTHDVNKAGSASGVSKISTSELFENVAGAPVNIFTDDILPEIFGNLKILDAKDLLNFRLVNRCWRDSATSILLKRNLCQINLSFGEVTTDDDGNAVCEVVEEWKYKCLNERFSRASFKYFNVNNPGLFLEDLNQVISTSLKFPSASISFHSDCGWMILRPPSEWPHAIPYQTDLLQFFALYGMEIKELSLSDRISIKALQNLVYVHMPQLTCLDIHDLTYFYFENDIQDESQMQVCPLLPSTFRIEKILIGICSVFREQKVRCLKDLISVCPNLREIYSAGEAALEILIEIKKYHLIKELKYSAQVCQTQAREQVAKLVKETIFEKKLPNFQLSQYRAFLCNTYDTGYGLDWFAMNIFLSASKNSLKWLHLDVDLPANILNFFVPPLPYLKYLELNDFLKQRPASFQFKFVGDVIRQSIKSGELTTNHLAFEDDFKAFVLRNQGTNYIPADYFPHLLKVKLCSSNLIKDPTKLLGFFSLEHLGPDGVTTVPGDTVPTVTTLELSTLPYDVGYMPKLFPNVSHLIVYCSSTSLLRNWVWTAFPKLKRLQITNKNFDNNWDAETVDCFFTGISQESRQNCYGKAISFKLGLGTENEKDFERTQPYIRDCNNVKKFEIEFWGKCASAAVYGFQKVTHRTKIILSLLSVMNPEMSSEEMEETLRKIEPVTAYVEIRIKK